MLRVKETGSLEVLRLKLRAERAVHLVAYEVECEYQKGYRKRRKQDHPPRISHEVLAIVKHVAPAYSARVAQS